MLNKRIAVLLAAGPASVAAVTDILDNDALSEIEKLDFLFGEFADHREDSLEFEVSTFGSGMTLEVFGLREPPAVPEVDERILFEESPLPRYRQIEFRSGGLRAALARSKSGGSAPQSRGRKK